MVQLKRSCQEFCNHALPSMPSTCLSYLWDPSTFSEGTWQYLGPQNLHNSVSNHLLRRYDWIPMPAPQNWSSSPAPAPSINIQADLPDMSKTCSRPCTGQAYHVKNATCCLIIIHHPERFTHPVWVFETHPNSKHFFNFVVHRCLHSLAQNATCRSNKQHAKQFKKKFRKSMVVPGWRCSRLQDEQIFHPQNHLFAPFHLRGEWHPQR